MDENDKDTQAEQPTEPAAAPTDPQRNVADNGSDDASDSTPEADGGDDAATAAAADTDAPVAETDAPDQDRRVEDEEPASYDAGSGSGSAGAGEDSDSGGSGMRWFMVLLILVALAVAGWFGWQRWQRAHQPLPQGDGSAAALSHSSADGAETAAKAGMDRDATQAAAEKKAAEQETARQKAAAQKAAAQGSAGQKAAQPHTAQPTTGKQEAAPDQAVNLKQPDQGVADQQAAAEQQAARRLMARQAELQRKLTAVAGQLQQLQAQVREQQAASQAKNHGAAADLSRLDTQLTQLRQAHAATQAKLNALSSQAGQLANQIHKVKSYRATTLREVRLEEIGLLLARAQQRHALLHDGVSALQSLRAARTLIGQLEDPAFAAVGRTLDDEIAALAATHPEAHADRMAQLREVIASWPDLPLKPINTPPPAEPGKAWERVKGALSSLVVVEHDAGKKDLEATNDRLTRQMARIDLVRARAALVNRDAATAAAALQRVRGTLQTQYDGTSQAVKRVERRLGELITQLQEVQSSHVELGAALAAFQQQRKALAAKAAATDTP